MMPAERLGDLLAYEVGGNTLLAYAVAAAVFFGAFFGLHIVKALAANRSDIEFAYPTQQLYVTQAPSAPDHAFRRLNE